MVPRRTYGELARADTHLVRSASWGGVRAGQAVDVAGTRLRNATWAFVAHVRNTRTGEEWIEVVGGRQGDKALRSFRPDQILPPAGRRPRRRAPLATAPLLPLD
jgi:hypothetical protein